jgi:hypothetical protein
MPDAMVAGFAEDIGTTYTSVHTAAASSITHGRVAVTNVAASVILVRLYSADGSWTTGEPAAGTLDAAIVRDAPVEPGQQLVYSVALAAAGELVVRSDTATSLDVSFMGVEET